MAFTRYLGLARETTFGVEATTGFVYVDAESAELEAAGDSIIVFEGMSGLDYSMTGGRYSIEGSFGLPVDDNAIGHIFRGVLGGYTKTGTAPSITHEFFADRTKVDTYTVQVGKDIVEQVYLGTGFVGTTLELEDGLLVASVDVVGQKDKKGVASPSKNLSAMTQGAIFSAKDVNITLGATDESGKIQSMSLTIENGMEPFFGFGSRFPSKHMKGGFLVEGEFTLAFESTAQLEKFWGGSTGPVVGTPSAFGVTVNVGPNMDIILPRAIYTQASQPVAGRDRLEQTVTVRGLVDAATGDGPVNITLTNSVTTY
jgi:hypothetical protein